MSMMNETTEPQPVEPTQPVFAPEQRLADEDVIYLSDILAALRRRVQLIITITAGMFLLGILYALFSTPLYTAQVVVRPLEINDGGKLASLSSQLGGVAALAGVDFGGGGSDRDEYIAILRSRELGEDFIRKYGLKPLLFPERWDPEAGKWKERGSGLLSKVARSLSRGVAILSGDQGWHPRRTEPSLWEAYKVFDEDVRKVSEDRDTGLVTVSMEYRDPRLAAKWANDYVALGNKKIRNNVIREATAALTYLDNEAQKATSAGLKDTIYRVIEAQLKRIALANARPEFAFKVVDKAVVPEERSHPKRALVILLALMLGGALGIFAAVASEAGKGRLMAERQTG